MISFAHSHCHCLPQLFVKAPMPKQRDIFLESISKGRQDLSVDETRWILEMSLLIAESSSSNLYNTIRAPVNLTLRLIAMKGSSTRRGRCY